MTTEREPVYNGVSIPIPMKILGTAIMDDDTTESPDPNEAGALSLNFNVMRAPLVHKTARVADHELPGVSLDASNPQPPTSTIFHTELLTIRGVPCIVEYRNETNVQAFIDEMPAEASAAFAPLAVHMYWNPKSDFAQRLGEMVNEATAKNPAIYASNWLGNVEYESGQVLQKICDDTGFLYEGGPALFALTLYMDDETNVPVENFPDILEHLGAEPFPQGGYWTHLIIHVEINSVDEYTTYIRDVLHQNLTETIMAVRASMTAEAAADE